MIKDETALYYAKKLREYCEHHKTCDFCAFHRYYDGYNIYPEGCDLNLTGIPENWRLKHETE